MVRITPGDLDDLRVVGLLRTHLANARAQTAPGSAHALDLAGPRRPDIRVWTAWDGDALLLGVGALKRLSPDHGEVKSMHTAEAVRGRGVGARRGAASSRRRAHADFRASAWRRARGTISGLPGRSTGATVSWNARRLPITRKTRTASSCRWT